jgi:rubrerythrin
MVTGRENLLEALIEAFSMETGTKDFYDYAAKNVGEEKAAGQFKHLAQWENSHMEYLKFLYQAVREDRETLTFDEFETKKMPVTHIEAGIGIKKARALFHKKDVKDAAGAIKMAVEIEGNAYNFYLRLARDAVDSNARVIFTHMSEQEKKHIEYLRKPG